MSLLTLITQHVLNCHSVRKYKCFNCEKSYAIDWQLKYHLKTCGFIWKCATCDKTYKERLSLITHCTRHSHVLPVEAQRRTRTKAKKEEKKESDNVQVMIFPVVMPSQNNHPSPINAPIPRPQPPPPVAHHVDHRLNIPGYHRPFAYEKMLMDFKHVADTSYVKDTSAQTELDFKNLSQNLSQNLSHLAHAW